ncbi:hypothetical protein HDC92_004767 [Pedobacter sp. AK017]|nr:hypothetical protein [Pedobacter sp. AK017]
MKSTINTYDYIKGIDNNQDQQEVTEIIEQIKAIKFLQHIDDELITATDKYIIKIKKIN